ncbi:MAG: hypothetical protein ABI601_05970 [bacterium]
MRHGRAIPASAFREVAGILGAAMITCAPALARAQSPWAATLTATMNPQPIGSCGAVALVLKDSTGRDAPRNPLGYRVSIADFDMTVASADPGAVAGQANGTNNWSVCACQAASVGSVATITASYPAAALATNARVPGVSFQLTAPFTIGRAMNANDPPSCATAGSQVVAAIPQSAPVSGGKTMPPSRGQPGAPISTSPPVASLPPGAPSNVALTGAPPTNVVVNGTPIVAHLTWSGAPNAVRHAVWRGQIGQLSVERTPALFTGFAFDDTIVDPRITYNYTVVAHHANGMTGSAPAVAFVSPPMVNPSGFTAVLSGPSAVTLTWQPVAGAARYRVDGPGFPSTGLHYTTTTATASLLPNGALSWKLTTLYPLNFADYSTPSIATAMVRRMPPRGQAWLSKNNGVGSAALASAHYAVPCPSWGGKACLGRVFWGDPNIGQQLKEAVYGNVNDLGFGRRTGCSQKMDTSSVHGLVTICYATSHGPAPGQTGFAVPAVITSAAAAQGVSVLNPAGDTIVFNPWGDQPRSGTVIIKSKAGAWFYALTVGKWDLDTKWIDWWDGSTGSWSQPPQALTSLALDTEGPKPVPHSCLACHGGVWNSGTKLVDGASLLPLDPNDLVFFGARTAQEEKIRTINAMIATSAPGTPITSYINGLYNGAVGNPGTVSRSYYVPAAWSAQPGLYQSIVKPYCASCHLAARSSVNFASWTNFLQNKALIYNAVCVARTMPHSEIAYREFWTKNTGAIYLPGLLATTLGYASCP